MPDLQLNIKQGKIKGCHYITKQGFKYIAYSGIPYAKPPVGELRFKDPVPADEWSGIRDATSEGQVCAQVERIFTQQYMGEEDCLYINIYVPILAKEGYNLPVMVWIHGGAFLMGSGNKIKQGPDYLLEKNVIVVTFNYRLGGLGFLCLNNAEVPGNAGLKDQILALDWVQNNIGKFGGDRDNVTIFGESAGSASVEYILLSKLGKGLYHRAIMQSGSCLSNWARQINPEENAFNLAKKFGLKSEDKKEVLEFLRKIPVKDLVTEIDKTSDIEKFIPVIEKEYPGVKSFISMLPSDIMNSGAYNSVPMIKGFNSQEGALILVIELFGDRNISAATSTDDPAVNFELYLPDKIHSLQPEKKLAIINQIKSYYYSKGKSITDAFIDLMSDVGFINDIHNSVKYMSTNGHPIYYYMFDYNGPLNLNKPIISYPYTGASRADDLSYLFKIDITSTDTDVNTKDEMMIKCMVEMWTNFAKVGLPTLRITDTVPTYWDPVTKDDINCLHIGDHMKMDINPFTERLDFLSMLFNIEN